MANRATVTYNGRTISTEDKEGNFNVTYNGSTIATIDAGQTKTLNCANQVMKTDVIVGGKTLNCAKYKMATNVIVSVVSLFPAAPSSYNLIDTYTSSQTWTAPENGYFQIEAFGASGNGGTTSTYSGGGGGGGGYSCSRVTLNKGDTIVLTVGSVGSITSAVVNSSHNNSYDHTLQVTSGANGNNGKSGAAGSGGAGGIGSNGNHDNATGSAGATGTQGNHFFGYPGAAGGAGANGAPNGGNSQSKKGVASGTDTAAGSGSPGFFKIYRGNTNISSGGSSSFLGYNVKYTGDLIDCTIEAYDSTGAKRSSNTTIYTNDYILIDPGYPVSLIPDFSIIPSGRATITEQIVDGKIKITFTSITGNITISIYL